MTNTNQIESKTSQIMKTKKSQTKNGRRSWNSPTITSLEITTGTQQLDPPEIS